MSQQTPFDVLSLGSPCVDRLIRVSHEFVKKIPGKKGGAMAVDYSTLLALIEDAGEKEELIPGGAASNTTRALAHFGHSCGISGVLSDDELGRFFLQSLEGLPITPLYQATATPTNQILCLVTPDGDRTQRPCVAVDGDLTPDHLQSEHFTGRRLCIFEGFSLRMSGLIEASFRLARKHKSPVAFGLASFEIVHEFRLDIMELLPQYVDLLFANHDEAKELTGLEPKMAAIALSKLVEVAIVTHGDKGCWIAKESRAIHVPTRPLTPIDVTGAGDAFMAGFLHGYLNSSPLSVCGEIGCIVGGAATQVTGPSLTATQWENVCSEVQPLL